MAQIAPTIRTAIYVWCTARLPESVNNLWISVYLVRGVVFFSHARCEHVGAGRKNTKKETGKDDI